MLTLSPWQAESATGSSLPISKSGAASAIAKLSDVTMTAMQSKASTINASAANHLSEAIIVSSVPFTTQTKGDGVSVEKISVWRSLAFGRYVVICFPLKKKRMQIGGGIIPERELGFPIIDALYATTPAPCPMRAPWAPNLRSKLHRRRRIAVARSVPWRATVCRRSSPGRPSVAPRSPASRAMPRAGSAVPACRP